MTTRLLAAAIFGAALLPMAAPAAENGNSSAMNSSQPLPQQIKSKLQQDGFTDVKVIPGSFLVSAKDKNGDNVNMIIGPHSMMMLTESQSNGSTTGSGSDNTTGSSPTGSSSEK